MAAPSEAALTHSFVLHFLFLVDRIHRAPTLRPSQLNCYEEGLKLQRKRKPDEAKLFIKYNDKSN